MADPPVLLYDGVCGLCNRILHFVLARDHRRQFRYASLQSDFGRAVLTRHGRDPDDLDTVALVLDPGGPDERILIKSQAIVHVVSRLGSVWRLAGALRVFPAGLVDLGYDLVAKNRYRFFGKHATCPMPSPEVRDRFIQV